MNVFFHMKQKEEYEKLEAIIYRGQENDLADLKQFAGGSVSGIYDTPLGLACVYETDQGVTFNMIPGCALCRIPGSTDHTDIFQISMDALFRLYKNDKGE